VEASRSGRERHAGDRGARIHPFDGTTSNPATSAALPVSDDYRDQAAQSDQQRDQHPSTERRYRNRFRRRIAGDDGPRMARRMDVYLRRGSIAGRQGIDDIDPAASLSGCLAEPFAKEERTLVTLVQEKNRRNGLKRSRHDAGVADVPPSKLCRHIERITASDATDADERERRSDRAPQSIKAGNKKPRRGGVF